jgi:hypothetical protein
MFPATAPFVTPARGWTAWSIIYRYPEETGTVPEPSAGELTEALEVIVCLAEMLQSSGPPPHRDEATQEA